MTEIKELVKELTGKKSELNISLDGAKISFMGKELKMEGNLRVRFAPLED